MATTNYGTDRYAALKATEKFLPGTIGYGVHKGIDLLYNGLPLVGGGFRNRYSAEIGVLFQRDDIQSLLAQPITNEAANFKVAQLEFEYWKSILINPNSLENDKIGAMIALKFSANDRATLQKYLATGQTFKAYKLIEEKFPKGLDFGLSNLIKNFLSDWAKGEDSDKIDAQYCFGKGTLILMSDGTYKPIEQIKIGDEVLAFDGLGELQPRKVTHTFITPDQEVVQLGNIKVTLGHHFLQPDGSFKALGEIDKNGYLVGVTGKLIPHPGIKPVAGKHTVYNFTVEELHTYVAGDYRVHNESLSNYLPVTTAGIIGAAVGGQISSFYADDNFASQLIAQSLGNYTGGLVLDALAYQFDPALSQESLSVAALYKRLPESFISVGINLVTSKLVSSIMKALKIEDPLAQIAISSLIHGGSFTSALGSFIGTQLHQTMIQKWNILSEDFSAKGATLGSGIGGILGSFIPIPVIGTAIGSLLGGIIGGTFGDKDYPRAAYTVTIENGIFVAKFAFNLDGGSTSLAQQMGNNARDILNFLASSVGGKASLTGDINIDLFFYGHYLNSYFYKPLAGQDAAGGSNPDRYPYRYGNAQDAIINGIIAQIKAAQFEGGDLYIKRLLKTLPTDVKTIDKLNADFQVAREWGIYKDNSVLYEKNLNYLKANAIKDAETRILDLRSRPQDAFTPSQNQIDPKIKDFNVNFLPSQITLSLQGSDLFINGEKFTNWVNAQQRVEILRFADGSRFKIVVNNGLVKLEDERVANWQQVQTRATQLKLDTPNASDSFVNNNASRIVQGSSYALKFDGFNDHLESTASIIPTTLGVINPFSVSVWAKIDPSIQKGLFELVSQGTQGNAFYIGGQNGKIRVGDTWINSGIDVPGDGQWHLYTVVRTPTNTQLYIDGELKASRGSAIANPANTVFRVGRQYGGFWEVPKATIGEVSIWNTAISATQIQTMTKQSLAGNEAGLVAYWQLNEGTGTIANDKSSFKRNLTIKEAEWTARNVGGIGDDIVIATGSGQLLDGDKGDDIYRYNRGQGTITIKDAGGLDTIEFDASIKASDLLFQQSGSNLIIALKDPNNPTAAISSLPNKLILSDFATNKIELLRLGNNEEYLITPTGLIPNKPTTGSNIPETFAGTYGADFLKVGTKVNGVLSFDGVNDSVQNPAKFADVKDTFTIEFWVNPTATRDSTPQNNYGVNNINQRYAIAPLNGASVLGSGNAYAGVSVGTNGISVFEHSSYTQNSKGSQTTVKYLPSLLVYDTTLSGWNHVAIVYNNKTPSLYLNGQFVKTGLPSTWIVHPSDVLGGFQYSQYEYPNYFQGFLDEVRIWNKVRTQTEIQADLNRPLIGNESGLVAYHNFNEATGTTVRDLTSYQNNGTIQGATRDIKPLMRSDGNDTYLYSLGDSANATIYDIGNYEGTIRDGGIDTLEFGTGITLNSLQLSLQTNNLIVKVNNTSTITIQDWIKPQSKIEIFRLADGKEYNPVLNFDGKVSLQAAFSPGNPNYNLATDKPTTYSVSPYKLLTFDLGADGLQLISAADSMTLFNIDNDAFPEQMGWVAPSDGFLVWDRNNDGLITSLNEFFSLEKQNQVSFLGDLDTNKDLIIDSKDSNFSQLRIWTDTNLNGEVELGELAALYRYGVNSISITPQTKNYNIAGNSITASTYFTRVGFDTRSYSQLYDVAFTYNPNGAKLEQIGSGLSRFYYENKPDIIFADDSASNINLIVDPIEVYSATGGKGNDVLTVKSGSTKGAVLSGGDGNDKLVGADGNDIFTGGAGIDSIDGGAGDDLITIDKNDNLNNIKGGLGFDVLVIEGDGDVSFILDNLGVEVVNGNPGNNVFTANGTQDVVISGGAGNDTITGGQGNDRLEGNEGNDSLNGRTGDDNLMGGLGDDNLIGGAGNDTVILNGKSTEYKFDFITSGSVIITDTQSNRDGKDTLVEIEFIRFADRNYRISELRDFEQFYRLVYKDVDNEVKAGLLNSGIQHYEIFGKKEGRLTANDFNEQFYRLISPDVDAAIKAGTIPSAIFHYINWGFAEKRATNFQFNEAFYRLVHPSVDAAIKAGTMPSAIHHYINHGYAEGRVTNLNFDEQYYRSANPSVDAAIKAGTMPSAIHHYINHGFQEKRIAKFNAVNSNAALWGSANSDILQGANGNNLIVGFDGNDFLDGGNGIDTAVYQGKFNEYHVVFYSTFTHVSDTVSNRNDTDTLLANVENVQFSDITLSLAQIRDMGARFSGLDGDDVVTGGKGNDFYVRGNAGNDKLYGLLGNDSLDGGDGNDFLDGGSGNDTMNGGSGNDTYIVDSTGDVVTETSTLATEIDEVQSSISYTLGVNVENLTLTGTAAINGTGNSLSNIITGNAANNTLNGGDGNDSLFGSAGNDTLSGGNGNDSLNGGAGNDTMNGGLGNDTYVIDSTSDVVTETSTLATEIDTVQSSISYTLGANLENLTLTGTAAINGTGNNLSNIITGNAANNTLNAGDANDSVFGMDGNDSLFGGTGNDTLSGGNGNDVLVGGAGNDNLSGNGGNDWFTYDTNAIFTASSIGSDIIQDFTRGSDKMVIDKTTFTAIKSNAGIGFSVANEFAVVSSDSAAATSQALIVFNSVNGRLFYNQNGIADGLGSGSLFATLSGVSTLQATDFIIQA